MSVMLDVADIAADQWGLVTTAQARQLGATPQALARLTRQGALERMVHGVYRVTGSPASPMDELRASWLAMEPGQFVADRIREEHPIVVSFRTAASVHGLGNLEADVLEFTSRQRKQSRRSDVRVHRGEVGPEEWTLVDGLPVTTPVRTIGDLAAAHVDGGHLAGVVRDAVTHLQVDTSQIAKVLRPHAHRYGAPLGNGEELLSQLLRESGVSESMERVVELAGGGAARNVDFRALSDQLATLQRAIAPTLRTHQAVTAAPGYQLAQQFAAANPGFKLSQQVAKMATPEITAALKNMPSMAHLTQASETVRRATSQQLLGAAGRPEPVDQDAEANPSADREDE